MVNGGRVAKRFSLRGSAAIPWRGGSRGFTLIELVMVVVIMAILAALAAPSMGRLIASQRVRSSTADLHLTLVKARSEAIKRNTNVTVSPTDGNWTSGWSILDPEGGPALDIRAASPSVAVATSVTQVVYSPTGRATASGGSSFVFTSPATDEARCVSVDPSGRPYVKKGDSCN